MLWHHASMIRILVYALAILHLGPGIAFAVLAFGCDSGLPSFDALCGKSQMQSFVIITGVLWVVLGLGAYVRVRWGRQGKTTLLS